MTLSTKTYHNLASALTPEVIDYIHNDERYVLFLNEIIPDAIVSKMGEVNESVLLELSYCIMDNIYINASHK